MGVIKLPQSGGGTDWSQYEITCGSGSTPTSTSYTTVLSITGGGYLKKALVVSSTSSMEYFYIRITIDSVIKFEGYCQYNTNRYTTGICTADYPLGDNTFRIKVATGFERTDAGTSKDYPYTGAGLTNSPVIIPQPVFFSSSLLIECKTLNGTSGGFYEYQLGVL